MTWRFLDAGPAPGARQMATDEALLEAVARGQSPPLLRVFAFQPVCLSLGRFQASKGQLSRSDIEGLDIVRRPTGGRAVLHCDDLCYAIVAPANDPDVGGGILDSYCRIARILSHALTLLGATDIRFRPADGHAPGSSSCFAALGPFELTLKGAKILGSAQVRRSSAFLQQGSIRLESDPQLENLLLKETAPSLRDLLGYRIAYSEAATALRNAFAEALGPLESSALRPDEVAQTATLERERYANPAWTWIR